jgi:hypothetical protein
LDISPLAPIKPGKEFEDYKSGEGSNRDDEAWANLYPQQVREYIREGSHIHDYIGVGWPDDCSLSGLQLSETE